MKIDGTFDTWQETGNNRGSGHKDQRNKVDGAVVAQPSGDEDLARETGRTGTGQYCGLRISRDPLKFIFW